MIVAAKVLVCECVCPEGVEVVAVDGVWGSSEPDRDRDHRQHAGAHPCEATARSRSVGYGAYAD
jgi:hypothetical protein